MDYNFRLMSAARAADDRLAEIALLHRREKRVHFHKQLCFTLEP